LPLPEIEPRFISHTAHRLVVIPTKLSPKMQRSTNSTLL
jgi:hypothetical protein